jgi:hypothetical protein
MGFGAMEVTKPYEFIGFGAMEVSSGLEGMFRLVLVSVWFLPPRQKSTRNQNETKIQSEDPAPGADPALEGSDIVLKHGEAISVA